MKLLLISRCPPYPIHLGDRLIIYHLARELGKRGYVIDLLAFYDRAEDATPEQRGNYQHLFRNITLIPEPARKQSDYVRRVYGRMFPQNAEQSWSPEMWRAIDAALEAEDYDVAQLFGGVQVYEYRALIDYLPNLIVPYESFSLFLRRALQIEQGNAARLKLIAQLIAARRYERRMFRGFDRVVVLTEIDSLALQLINRRLQVEVIPNGIDLEFFTPPRSAAPTNDKALIMSFIGNYEYAPNVDGALFLARDVFPRVLAALPDVRLQLVGNAPPPELQAVASDQIEVTGRVPDVRPYLTASTVFMSPLRYGAGIKNKVLEAMAMQKAIIATRLSADGIGLQNGENVIYAQTAEEFSAAAIHLLGDPVLRQHMGQLNRKLIETRFSWAQIAATYDKLYKTIITERVMSSGGVVGV